MFEQTNDGLIIYGYHLCGIENLGEVFCKIVVDEDFVTVYSGNDLIWQIEKKYVKTIGVDQEWKDKKSPFGRAIVGGLLAGVWGAAIGALSAELTSVDMLVSSIETEDTLLLFKSA